MCAQIESNNKSQNNRISDDELYRFSLVIIWIVVLLIYYLMTNSECFKEDLWDQYLSPNNSQLISEIIADSGEISLDSHYLALDNYDRADNDSDLEITEYKKYVSTFEANESVLCNKKLQLYPGLARKLSSILAKKNAGLRVIVFSDKHNYQDINIFLYMWNKLLWGLLALLAFGILIIALSNKTNPFKSFLKSWFSTITIVFICIVGLLQSVFIFVQGGLIISPVGKASSVIIPILLAHSVSLIQTKKAEKTKKKIIWWFLPLIIFVFGHGGAHIMANRLYPPTISEILYIINSKYHIYASMFGVSFGILSLLTRLMANNSKEKSSNSEKVKVT